MGELENQIIEYALRKFNIDNFVDCPYDEIQDYFSLEKKEYTSIRNIITIAEIEGLIIFSGNTNQSAKLTPKGKNIMENGGWLKHIENEKEKAKSNSEKEKYDLLNKKSSYKNRRIPYLISFFALVISFISFYTNWKKQQLQIEKLQKENKLLKTKDSLFINKKPNG
jgi:hypothetical protein